MSVPSSSDPGSVRGVAAAVRSGQTAAVEVLEAAQQRMEALEPRLSAMVRSFGSAIDRAREIDAAVAAGTDPGPLAGVPVAVKDNISVEGEPLTCGSRFLEGYRSPYDATVVGRLRAAGAVLVGHTNMDEFGMGSSCENSAFFPTRNPWDTDRVPGGSSGGSAAAVAAGYVPAALGSDTGGSIRQPAALCGVVGLKPTYGRVSRYGLVAFASSLDQIGPLTGDVADAALMLEVLAGLDPLDTTSSERPVPDLQEAIDDGVRGVRVGIVRQFRNDGLASDVASDWRRVTDLLAQGGAEVVEVDLPSVEAAIATYYVLATAEASANLARFDGMRYGRRAAGGSLIDVYRDSRSQGFGAEVKRRILLGTFSLSSGYIDAYYGRACAVAERLRDEFQRAFESCDVLLTPTSPTTAFALGERTQDPLTMYLSDVFTTPASLAGLPALAVPTGRDGEGLPLSAQLLGRPFDEATLLRCGAYVEREAGGPGRPPLGEGAR